MSTNSILHEYILLREHTESPTTFHRWSFISCAAACLARNVWFQWGSKRVYPVMYIMCVGSPGTRKSAAVGPARRLLARAEYKRFSCDKTSKPQFVADLARMDNFDEALTAGPDHVDETFILNDEFLDFIGQNNSDFTTFLTKMWDCPPEHKESFKRSSDVTIMNPCINILAGMTPSGIQLAFPGDIMGTGFLSRPILVYSEPTQRKITFPTSPTQEQEQVFVDAFKRMRTMKGEMKFTPEAMRLVDLIYQNFQPLPDVRLTYYCARRLEHMLRLCIALAGIHDTYLMTADIVTEAHTILTAAEELMNRAYGEYGKSKLSDATNAVIATLETNNRPMNADELYKAVSTHLEGYADIFRVLQNLVRADRIISSNNTFILKYAGKSDRRKYTDFGKYIEEAEYYDQYIAAQNAIEAEHRAYVSGHSGPQTVM